MGFLRLQSYLRVHFLRAKALKCIHAFLLRRPTMTHTHTVRNNRVKEPTNQTNQKVKAMSMDPLQMWSHGTTNTLLDGKQSSGTLKRKYICLLDKVISLFFLPLCVVCHDTARCFFSYNVTVYCNRKGPSVMLKQVASLGDIFLYIKGLH